MSKDNFYTQNLWLWLPFREATGTIVKDRSIWRITPFTLHGTPTWTLLASGIYVLDFNAGTPDWLDCPQASTAKLDFTTEDFSIVVWAKIDDATTRTLLCRGVANTDGWLMQVSNTGRLGFATFQAAGTQTTYSSVQVSPGFWYLLGIIRDEAVVRTYVNGVDVTDAPDTHVDPTTSNRELHIGIRDDETSDPWDGQMWNPRIWGRVLESWEHAELFNMERHLLGV